MSSYSLLDQFPVELIHHLFNYFSAYEIFYTFTQVSLYIDDVLQSYPNYSLNCKSMTRKQFDFVCQRIQPDQVISLTLSDNEETPGQIERFLSRFPIDRFPRLRSLTLVDVGADFWEVIMTKLITLTNLRLFFYEPTSTVHSWICNISDENVTELDQRLFRSYAPVLPQLDRLKLSHGDFLESIQFHSLRHLIIRKCKMNIAQRISHATPQLKTLHITLDCNPSNTNFILPFEQLNRLILRIEGIDITIDNMEQLMSKLGNLKYLELNGHGGEDLIDGQRWQTITNHLDTFNFLLSLSSDIDVQNLDSFRTPFWLVEKQWYVAYNTSDFLFTVPFFARTRADEKFQFPRLTTAPDLTIFYQSITRLALSRSVFPIRHRFSQVQTLAISAHVQFPLIEQIIDLNRIHRLIISSINQFDQIFLLINALPNLHRIAIIDNIKYFLKQIPSLTFENIQTLEIGSFYSLTSTNTGSNRCNTKQIATMFPQLKHLHIRHRCSPSKMLGFIRQCKHLNNASFRFTESYFYSKSVIEYIAEIQSAFDRYRSSQWHDFTYRFGSQSVYVWL